MNVHQQKSIVFTQWCAYTLWAENSLSFLDGILVVCWWYAHVIYGHVACGMYVCIPAKICSFYTMVCIYPVSREFTDFLDGNLVVCWWYAQVICGHVQEKLVACMYVHQQKSIVFTQWCAYTLWAENSLRMVFLWCAHVIYGHVQEKLVACMYVCFGEEGATEVTWLMSATK